MSGADEVRADVARLEFATSAAAISASWMLPLVSTSRCAMFRRALTGVHAMMRDVLDRSILVAAAIATAAIGWASLAHADPECLSGRCAPAPGHSASYQNGYSSEHDFYSIPKNHEYLKNEMRDGYNARLVCQVEINGGPQPPSVTDWISGCIDALHDLGFKP